MTQADVVYADVKFKKYNRRNPGETSSAPETTYSEVKFKQPSAETSSPTEAVYSDVQSVQKPSDSQKQAPAAGGSKVTCERATLAILATLLAAAVVALIAVSWYYVQTKDLNRNLTDIRKELKEKLQHVTSRNKILTDSYNKINESLNQMTRVNKNLTESNSELNESLHHTRNMNKNLTESNDKLKDTLDKMTCPAAVNTTVPCPPCPEDWEEHGHQCYLFNQQLANWTLARKQCQQQGADLVRIDSEDEQTFLTRRLNEKMEELEDKFWIGLTDARTEDEWLWVDGSPLNQRGFWQTTGKLNEPDNWKGENRKDGEDCARMGEKSENLYNWLDKDCNSKQNSICEKPAVRGHLFCI